MKVEYNDGDCALVSGKIEVRWRLDTSKKQKEIEIEYNDGNFALKLGKMKYDEARMKCWGFCPLIRVGNKIWLDLA